MAQARIETELRYRIRLTDEEMWDIACEFQKDILETGSVGNLCKAIRKAQLKKALQEVEDYIARDLEWANEENEMLWKNKLRIWRQALLEEIK